MSAAAAAELNPVARRRPERRWRRRLFLAGVAAPAVLWMARVPLLNAGLQFLPGGFAVRVTGFHPGWHGVTFSGVRAVHRKTGREMAVVPEVRVEGSWSRMAWGQLARLTLIRPELTWCDEFYPDEPVPEVMGPPARPLVSWEQGEIQGGSFAWYSPGRESPRLSWNIDRYSGGALTIFNDGTVGAAEQFLSLRDLVSREWALDGAMEIVSRSQAATGIATAQQPWNRYTFDQVVLHGAGSHLRWQRRPAGPPVTAPGPAYPLPSWYQPAGFQVVRGESGPGTLELSVETPGAGPVDFAAAPAVVQVEGLRWGGGKPCTFTGSSVTLDQIKSPGAALEARAMAFRASLDEKTRLLVTSAAINGARVGDSSRLLAALGISPEEAQRLPVCRAGLDAKCVNLLISEDGVSSADSQEVILEGFSAVRPGDGKPVASAGRLEVQGVPDEARRDRRLRSVRVDKAEVTLADFSLPSANPEADGSAAEAGPSLWSGWYTDSLTVRDGMVHATDLGPGIPVASGAFAVQTGPREPGGEALYRVELEHITLANPLFPAFPLRSSSVVSLDLHPVRLWGDEPAGELRINGEKVEWKDAMQKLLVPRAGKSAAGNPEPSP